MNIHTPKEQGLTQRTIITPKEGWKANTYYVCEVAFSENNVIHKSLFFSGFLENGQPFAYNQIFNPTYDGVANISNVYYLKPLFAILNENLNRLRK